MKNETNNTKASKRTKELAKELKALKERMARATCIRGSAYGAPANIVEALAGRIETKAASLAKSRENDKLYGGEEWYASH